jgi:signal transduction histidine kinase
VAHLRLAGDDFLRVQGYLGPVNQSQLAGRVDLSRRMNRFVARLLAIPPRVTDLALAGGLMLLPINLGITGSPPQSLRDTLLLVAGAASVAVRRRWPLAVLAATLVPYVVTPDTGPAQPALFVALYTVATLRSQRTTMLATALAAAASGVAVAVHGGDWGLMLSRVVEVALASIVGLAVAERRRQRERETTMLAQIAAGDERVRIARELHDVVAHHLSVIVVQANLAAETVEPDHPAFAPTRAIVAAGREALADMRRVLGVLRTHDNAEERAPQPGLAALDDLLARVRAAGVEVRLSSEGDSPALPTGLDLTAYRIIQEALTNTLRHAHASEARVSIKYSPHLIAVEVADNGIGPGGNGSTSAGHGLDGMRERVALFGGTVTAGPNRGRGYLVHAELPL